MIHFPLVLLLLQHHTAGISNFMCKW